MKGSKTLPSSDETRTAQRARSAAARRRVHGPNYERDFAGMWDAQGGRCYLCGIPMDRGAVVDHDHSCCPPAKSCDACRRGLACNRCNRLIGQVDDSSEMLRLIADNLDKATAAMRSRTPKLRPGALAGRSLPRFTFVAPPALLASAASPDTGPTFREQAVSSMRAYLVGLGKGVTFTPRDIYGVVCPQTGRSSGWVRSELLAFVERGLLEHDGFDGTYRVLAGPDERS